MRRLFVQEYLWAGATLAQLKDVYAINARRHSRYPSLVQLKYNQIDSPMGERIVQECRGLILDTANNWRVVAWPFDKFFNHGEGHAAPIDWSTAEVQEKIDGSLIIVYEYDGEWRIATSGTPDASGLVNNLAGLTFAELFRQALGAAGVGMPPPRSYESLTFMFELTSKYNRVVVQHADVGVTLIGVRDRKTGQEFSPRSFAESFPTVKSYPLQSFTDIQATFAAMSPLQQEGYVVVDADFHRVKVKHPGYVAIHHMKDGFGTRRMVELIRAGEASELLVYYPEWRPEFERVEGAYNDLLRQVGADYDRIKDIAGQKDFALEAVQTRCSSVLFAIRNGSAKSAREFFAKMSIQNFVRLLGLHEVAVEATE